MLYGTILSNPIQAIIELMLFIIGHVVKTNKKDFLMNTYKYNMEEDNIPQYLLEFYPIFLLRPL